MPSSRTLNSLQAIFSGRERHQESQSAPNHIASAQTVMQPSSTHTLRIRVLLGLYSAIGLVALACLALTDWQRLPLVNSWLHSLAIALGASAVLIALNKALLRHFKPARLLQREFQILLRRAPKLPMGLAVALGSVVEEIVFRAILLPNIGLVLSSIAFGLLHFGRTAVFVWWTIWATAMGFAFGGVAVWSGDCLAPSVAHIIVNFFSLYWIWQTQPTSRARSA